MQPYPWSPDLVWPGHLHGTGCLSARAVGTGLPTVVRRLCLGPGCGWVWVSLTPPVLAGVLGGCVWAGFVVLSLFYRLFVVFVVGLRFRPAYGTCVGSCALRLPPCRFWFRCAVWACVLGPGLGCAPPFLAGLSGCVFCAFFFCSVVSVAGCPCPGPCGPCPPNPFSFGLGCWLFFFFVVCVCMFGCPFFRWAAVPGFVLPFLAGWSPCACLGVLSSVPSGWGVWPPLVVLAGDLEALGCFRAPPPPPPVFCFLGGGLPVPPSAFHRLAHALARI